MTKYIFFLIVLLGSATLCGATEPTDPPYPIRLELKTSSSEIHYGDFLMTSVHLTNDGPLKIVVCIDPRAYWGYANAVYSLHAAENEQELFRWESEDEFYAKESTTVMWPARNELRIPKTAVVSPGETVEICYRPIWIPQPDMKGDHFRKDFASRFQREQTVTLRFRVNLTNMMFGPNWSVEKNEYLPWEEVRAWRRETSDAVPGYYLREHGYSPQLFTAETTLKILPRATKEYDLIRAWYQEIPGFYVWNDNTLFQFVDYDRDSPFFTTAGQGREKAGPFWLSHQKEHADFVQKTLTRNDFTLQRIAKSKELEAEIVRLSQEPDTTISQSMKEFVQLRGFLVDMRYAENDETAFEKLMDFVDGTQNETLWVKLLDEIVFHYIRNDCGFKADNVKHYREQFVKRFQIK